MHLSICWQVPNCYVGKDRAPGGRATGARRRFWPPVCGPPSLSPHQLHHSGPPSVHPVPTSGFRMSTRSLSAPPPASAGNSLLRSPESGSCCWNPGSVFISPFQGAPMSGVPQLGLSCSGLASTLTPLQNDPPSKCKGWKKIFFSAHLGFSVNWTRVGLVREKQTEVSRGVPCACTGEHSAVRNSEA